MIWIRIVTKDGAPATSLALGVPVAARFGDSVGDIGRGVGCTLVLPDTNREISRKQALVTWQAGRHFIRPIGTNVSVVLNGRTLPPDAETPLDVGAEIRVGPYVMRVEASSAESAVPAKPASPASIAPSARPLAAAPPRAAAPPQRPQGAQPPAQAALASRNAAQDPLAVFNDPNRPARGGAFDDVLKGSDRAGAVGAAQRPAARPLPFPPDARMPAPPPKAVPPVAASPSKGASQVAAPGQKAASPVANPAKAERVPAASPPLAPSTSAAGAQSAGAPANDEFVSAIYGGLGMPVPPPAERSAHKLRLVGELLRESLAGTIELLAARQIAKKNLGASATMLQTRGNNPLKFSPNVDAALTYLLGPPLRGFIGPRDAVRDALGDLRAHQVAMLAGMRAALEAVLERFDPTALEARLAPKGMMDQLMPLNRRAKLWETFGEQYAEILREVEDDWDALFGKAFLQAYERQLAELARAPTVDDDSVG